MASRRFALSAVLVSLASLVGAAGVPADAPPIRPAGPDPVFYYPLRAGESLTDVSRIFRVPVPELMELNHIADPNHLSIGQPLKVPDSFARDTANLQAERDRLLEEKRKMEADSATRQQTVAELEGRVQDLEAEKASLERAVWAAVQWQRSAKLLIALVFLVFAWALKSRIDKVLATRRLAAATLENAALTAAKEKYREAVSQLELRYHKLHHGKGEEPRDVVSDGEMRLARAFEEGTREIERLLAEFHTEQGTEPPASPSLRARLTQPLRLFLGRHLLKYHAP